MWKFGAVFWVCVVSFCFVKLKKNVLMDNPSEVMKVDGSNPGEMRCLIALTRMAIADTDDDEKKNKVMTSLMKQLRGNARTYAITQELYSGEVEKACDVLMKRFVPEVPIVDVTDALLRATPHGKEKVCDFVSRMWLIVANGGRKKEELGVQVLRRLIDCLRVTLVDGIDTKSVSVAFDPSPTPEDVASAIEHVEEHCRVREKIPGASIWKLVGYQDYEGGYVDRRRGEFRRRDGPGPRYPAGLGVQTPYVPAVRAPVVNPVVKPVTPTRPRCEGCGKMGHTESQCWSVHPELKAKRTGREGAMRGIDTSGVADGARATRSGKALN